MIDLSLTKAEAGALTYLLDLAVKAGGIKVAAPAAGLMQKLAEATKANETRNIEQSKD
jgi:hypothetical protein